MALYCQYTLSIHMFLVNLTDSKMSQSKPIKSSTATTEKKLNVQSRRVHGGEMGSWTIYVTGTPMPPYQPNQDCSSQQLVASQPSSINNNWVKIPVANPGELVQWELKDRRQQVDLPPLTEPRQSREVLEDAYSYFQIQESERIKPGTIRASRESDQPNQPQLKIPKYPIVIDKSPKVSSKRKRKLDTSGEHMCPFFPQHEQGSACPCFQRKTILDAFSLSAGPEIPGESRLLILFHQKQLVIQKQVLLSLLDRIGFRVKTFAQSQDTFKRLSARDQEVLLRNNIPLYIQYILARYISSGSGMEQIAWILGCQLIPQLIDDRVTAIHKVLI